MSAPELTGPIEAHWVSDGETRLEGGFVKRLGRWQWCWRARRYGPNDLLLQDTMLYNAAWDSERWHA